MFSPPRADARLRLHARARLALGGVEEIFLHLLDQDLALGLLDLVENDIPTPLSTNSGSDLPHCRDMSSSLSRLLSEHLTFASDQVVGAGKQPPLSGLCIIERRDVIAHHHALDLNPGQLLANHQRKTPGLICGVTDEPLAQCHNLL